MAHSQRYHVRFPAATSKSEGNHGSAFKYDDLFEFFLGTRSDHCGTKRQDSALAAEAMLAGKVPMCPTCAANPPRSLNADLPPDYPPQVCDLYDKVRLLLTTVCRSSWSTA